MRSLPASPTGCKLIQSEQSHLGKYLADPTRRPDWDYAKSGHYHIASIAQAWQPFFYKHLIYTEHDLDNRREFIHLKPERAPQYGL